MNNLTGKQRERPESVSGSYLTEQGAVYLLSGGGSTVAVTRTVEQLTHWHFVLSNITQHWQHLWPQLLQIISYHCHPSNKKENKRLAWCPALSLCVKGWGVPGLSGTLLATGSIRLKWTFSAMSLFRKCPLLSSVSNVEVNIAFACNLILSRILRCLPSEMSKLK